MGKKRMSASVYMQWQPISYLKFLMECFKLLSNKIQRNRTQRRKNRRKSKFPKKMERKWDKNKISF